MSLLKSTEKSISDRQENVSRLKQEISHLEELRAGRDSEFWKIRLGPAIANSIRANEAQRDAILDAPTKDAAAELSNIKALAGGIRAYKHILESVEKSEKLIEEKQDRIKRIRQELEEIKAEQGGGPDDQES